MAISIPKMRSYVSVVSDSCDAMPRRIQTPCRYPGCRSVSDHIYCSQHQRTAEHELVRIRGTSAERGYDARHRKWRRAVLVRHPLCQMCLKKGKTITATVADHIIPLNPRDPASGNWSVEENGQGLCHACHNRKTANDRMGLPT